MNVRTAEHRQRQEVQAGAAGICTVSIIKGLQTVNESNISQQTVKAESNAAQTETANNTTKTVSLLEALLMVMSGTFGENGMNIEVKPTIENTVTLDGKVIAKNTTEWQENEQIQHNK